MATISKTPKSAECRFGTGDFEGQGDRCRTGTDDPSMATKVRSQKKGRIGLEISKRGNRTPQPRIDREGNQGSADRNDEVN